MALIYRKRLERKSLAFTKLSSPRLLLRVAQASNGVSNEERKRRAEEDAKIKEVAGSFAGRAIWHFLHTGVTTSLYMRGAETEPDSNPQKPGGDGDDSSFIEKLHTKFGDMIEIEPHDCAKEGLKSEKYDIVLLKGDWELLTGDPWKYPKEKILPTSYGYGEAQREAARKFEEKLRKDEERAVAAKHKQWTEAQRATLTAMLMYIVKTEGRENLPGSFRPAPSQGGEAGGRWSWAIVMDHQIRHDEGGLERANLVIAVLDRHYLLPKIVLTPLESYEQRWAEANLRVSTRLLQDFQDKVKGGSAYMAVDSIGEMASYSRTEVGLLLAGYVWHAPPPCGKRLVPASFSSPCSPRTDSSKRSTSSCSRLCGSACSGSDGKSRRPRGPRRTSERTTSW